MTSICHFKISKEPDTQDDLDLPTLLDTLGFNIYRVLKQTPHRFYLDLMLHLAQNFHVQKETWLDSRWSIPLKHEWRHAPTLPVKSRKPLLGNICP